MVRYLHAVHGIAICYYQYYEMRRPLPPQAADADIID